MFNSDLQQYLNTLKSKKIGCEATFRSALNVCIKSGREGIDDFLEVYLSDRSKLSPKSAQFLLRALRWIEKNTGAKYQIPPECLEDMREPIQKDLGHFDEYSADDLYDMAAIIEDGAATVAFVLNALRLPRSAWTEFVRLQGDTLVFKHYKVSLENDELSFAKEFLTDEAVTQFRRIQARHSSELTRADQAHEMQAYLNRPVTATVACNSSIVSYLRQTGAAGFPDCDQRRRVKAGRTKAAVHKWLERGNISQETFDECMRVDK